jgi:hypothetical protein
MPLARRSGLALVAGLLLVAGPLTPLSPLTPSARAALVPMTFSGGGGSPLTITLPQPVTYTVTTAPSIGALFDFKGVGNLFGGTLNVSGTLTYTVNGGAPITINTGDTGAATGAAIAANDLILFHNPLPGAALGNTIVLSAGSVTTAINIPAAAPANGSYAAILVDPNGVQVGVGDVPEPAAVALLAAAAAPALLARRRRPPSA